MKCFSACNIALKYKNKKREITRVKKENYLDQKKSIEGVVKAAKVSGCKVQKLPYPLEGPSLSKADNAKDEAEAEGSVQSVDWDAQLHHGAHEAGYSVCLERTVALL